MKITLRIRIIITRKSVELKEERVMSRDESKTESTGWSDGGRATKRDENNKS